MILLVNTEFVFPSGKITKIAISGWTNQNLIATSFVEELLQDPKNQRYCEYVKDHDVIQFHHRRDYLDSTKCQVCDFPLTNTLVILGKQWIKERKVTFNREIQVLPLCNYDVWYRLQLKPANKVSLVVIKSVQNSINKETENSTDAIKEEPKKESNTPQDRTLFEPELFNEDIDVGNVEQTCADVFGETDEVVVVANTCTTIAIVCDQLSDDVPVSNQSETLPIFTNTLVPNFAMILEIVVPVHIHRISIMRCFFYRLFIRRQFLIPKSFLYQTLVRRDLHHNLIVGGYGLWVINVISHIMLIISLYKTQGGLILNNGDLMRT